MLFDNRGFVNPIYLTYMRKWLSTSIKNFEKPMIDRSNLRKEMMSEVLGKNFDPTT